MIEIKRLSNCPLSEVLDAWNTGFKGYFTEMTMTVDRFLQRMTQEGFSADDSIVAYVNDIPAGIVLNGFRMIDDQIIGYNGGTAVAPEYRRIGVGKRMMESVLDIYKEREVDIATLEAISENQPAIRLYESLGYEISDKVEYLQQDGMLHAEFEDFELNREFQFERTSPEIVSHLSFYNKQAPWQTQWQSVANGEAMIVSYEGKQVGYATYRRLLKSDGSVGSLIIHQIGIAQDFPDPRTLTDTILYKILEPSKHCKRLVINLPINAQPYYEAIRNRGFFPMVQQVCLKKVIKETSKPNAESIKKI